MKRLREARNTINEAERLIEIMKHELDETRNFLYRALLLSDGKVKDGVVNVPDEFQFVMGESVGDSDTLEIKIHKSHVIASTYQDIQMRYDELMK